VSEKSAATPLYVVITDIFNENISVGAAADSTGTVRSHGIAE